MGKRMLVDAAHPEETRVVVVNGTKLEEFDVETASKKQLKGNIYLAKVIRIEPSLQAAFVDYGGNRHGFLAFSEIHPDYYQIPVADREALLAEQQAQRVRQEAREEREAEERAARRARRHDSGGRRGPAHHEQDRYGDAARPDGDGQNTDQADGGNRQPDDHLANDGQQTDRFADQQSQFTDPAGVPAGDDHGGERNDPPANLPSDAIGQADAVDTIVTDLGKIADPAQGGQQLVQPADDTAAREHERRSDGEADYQAAPVARDAIYGDAIDAQPAPTDGTDAVASDMPPSDTTSGGEDGPRLTQVEEIKAAPETVETVGGEDDEEEEEEERPRRAAMLRNYKIQEVIKRRQIMLVQVVKEERGNKGAALTTYLSLAGRYCVLMPNAGRGGGISRKITNPADRKRMREMLQELEAPQGTGVILRTAGLERNKIDIKRDYDYLARLWENIRELTLRSTAPALIYEEGNLIKRSIRDLYGKDIEEIHVEGDEGYNAAKEFMRQILPSHAKKVELYNEAIPLFHRYQVEAQLDAMHSPVVQLRSGGYIVINPTEALVAIDVNSGRSTKERNIEETAVRTNVEAAEEIARQLRLRDLAGLIVIDFIDMEDSRHQQQVERRLKEAMRVDRARIQIGRISHFGLLEMSRQRLRPALHESATELCAHCEGTGRIRSTESTVLHVLRAIEEEGIRRRSSEITVAVPTHVALYLLNQKRAKLSDIERRYGFVVTIAGDDELIPPNFRLDRVKSRPVGEMLPAPVTVATAQYDEAPDNDAVEADAAVPIDNFEARDDSFRPEPRSVERVSERDDERTGDRGGDRGEGDHNRRRRRRRGRGRPGDGDGPRERPYDANIDQPALPLASAAPGTAGDNPFPAAPPLASGANRAGDGNGGMRGENGEELTHDGPRGPGDGGDEAGGRRRRGRRGGRRRRRFDGPEGERPANRDGGPGQGERNFEPRRRDDGHDQDGQDNRGFAAPDHGQPGPSDRGDGRSAGEQAPDRHTERPERVPATADQASGDHPRIISDPNAERVVRTDDKPPEPKRGWWQRLMS